MREALSSRTSSLGHRGELSKHDAPLMSTDKYLGSSSALRTNEKTCVASIFF